MRPRRTFRSVRAQALHYLARPHRAIPDRPIDSPAAWRAAEVADEDAWTHHLSAGEVAEIDAALDRCDVPLDRLHARDLPLPRLAPRIAAWRAEVVDGRGFIRVRGVPVDRWPLPRIERFFYALGQHLGRPGAQNGDGELLGHVRDLRLGRDGEVRQYKTDEAIMHHCDAADAVGLLCVRAAEHGGLSRIASSVTVFNRLVAERPDLARLLFEPTAFDARGDGDTEFFRARPCAYDGRRLRTFYHSEYMRTASRHRGVAELDRARRELLDRYDALASAPENRVEMELVPGDIQLISNHTIVHSRTGYVDRDDPALRRHLLRLWLTLESPGSLIERLRRARSLAELVAGLARQRLARRRSR